MTQEEHKTLPAWKDTPDFIGISLRDYFAAAALQGFCANHKALAENVKECKAMTNELGVDMRADMPRDNLALICFQIADAMLKVRDEQKRDKSAA